jgi:HK97 family phage major capsid protein
VKAKLDALEADITKVTGALEKAQPTSPRRSSAAPAAIISPEAKEHATAFNLFFRKGREPDAGMRELEVNAKLTTQSDPDGGYLVPEQMEGTIDRVLGTVSAIRGMSRVINISARPTRSWSTGRRGVRLGRRAESRGRDLTPTLREIAINAHELYAQPAATQTALDDSVFDVEQWLADEVSIEFAEEEGAPSSTATA